MSLISFKDQCSIHTLNIHPSFTHPFPHPQPLGIAMDPVVPGPRHTRPLARPRLDAPPSKRFVAAPQRSSAWRWAALAATRRATVARGEAEWVPKKEPWQPWLRTDGKIWEVLVFF